MEKFAKTMGRTLKSLEFVHHKPKQKNRNERINYNEENMC